MKLAAWVSVQKAWSNLSVREKSLTSWAATLLGAAVLWTWGLAPAMKIQHVDPAIGAALQAQTQAAASASPSAAKNTSHERAGCWPRFAKQRCPIAWQHGSFER